MKPTEEKNASEVDAARCYQTGDSHFRSLAGSLKNTPLQTMTMRNANSNDGARPGLAGEELFRLAPKYLHILEESPEGVP